MAKRNVITTEHLRKYLDYDRGTGVFLWKTRTPDMFKNTANRSADHACANWNSRYAGVKAGAETVRGYVTISILKHSFYGHQIAWAIETGEWPQCGIDHIDGDGTNNRLENLRLASQLQNCQNNKLRSDSTSGYTGVHWNKQKKRWQAHISASHKTKFLGFFDNIEKAYAAYLDAKKERHTFNPVPRQK